jgi:hypothetical protein
VCLESSEEANRLGQSEGWGKEQELGVRGEREGEDREGVG